MHKEVEQIKEAAKSNDIDYINSIIKKNVDFSMESYIKNFLGKKAYTSYIITKAQSKL